MSWTRKSDFYTYIRQDKLDEVLYDDDTLLTNAANSAVEEVASFMRHYYDTERIFKSILGYSDTNIYHAQDLIEWTEDDYDESTTYNTDDRAVYLSKIYKCNDDGITGAWNASKWDYLADDNSLFYAVNTTIGNLPTDIVTYTANSYTSRFDLITGWDRITDTSLYFKRINEYIYIYLTESARDNNGTPEARLFYPEEALDLPATVDIIPYGNNTIGGQLEIHGFIDDEQDWQVDTTKYWISGDNRNQKLLQVVIDVTLYHLHSRIQPRNIPTLRKERYDGNVPDQVGGAIGWLKGIRKGINNLDLPVYSDEKKGANITYGSEQANNFNY